MISKIQVEVIPHGKQRYDTLGDWYFEDDTLVVKVSETGEWRSNMLIAVHEIVEVLLCKQAGVTQEQVDAFDRAHADADEPGDLPDAPYGKQHCFAMAVERMLAAALDLTWADHEELCEETTDEPHPSRQHGGAVSG